MALSMVINYPERVRKMVMMGPMGCEFDISNGLNAVRGYQPSLENMFKMIDLFTYNKQFATQELAKARYEASIEPGFQ